MPILTWTAFNAIRCYRHSREVARARVVATGTVGHGSVPRLDNPLIHIKVVEKVGRWGAQVRLNETTRAYFENSQASARQKEPPATGPYKTALAPSKRSNIHGERARLVFHPFALQLFR